MTFSSRGHSDEQAIRAIINMFFFFSSWPFADFMNEMVSSIAAVSADLARASRRTMNPSYCSLVEHTAIPPTF